MKIIKNILAVIIVIILTAVYMIDRVVLILLPWIEIPGILQWLPKHTDPEEIKKEFPTMSDEAIYDLSSIRKTMNKMIKGSIVRATITAFVAMCVYVIWM